MKKKRQWRISCWVAIGMVISVSLAYVYGGEALPYVVFLCYVGAVCVMAMVYAAINSGYDDKIEDVEALREKLANKTKLAEDQVKTIKFLYRERESLNRECEAYRTQRDEAHIREELYKKQIREMRGRVEYWRMKYRAIVDVEADPTDEIVITPNTEKE